MRPYSLRPHSKTRPRSARTPSIAQPPSACRSINPLCPETAAHRRPREGEVSRPADRLPQSRLRTRYRRPRDCRPEVVTVAMATTHLQKVWRRTSVAPRAMVDSKLIRWLSGLFGNQARRGALNDAHAFHQEPGGLPPICRPQSVQNPSGANNPWKGKTDFRKISDAHRAGRNGQYHTLIVPYGSHDSR